MCVCCGGLSVGISNTYVTSEKLTIESKEVSRDILLDCLFRLGPMNETQTQSPVFRLSAGSIAQDRQKVPGILDSFCSDETETDDYSCLNSSLR